MTSKIILDNTSRNYLVISSNIHERYTYVLNEISMSMDISQEKVINNPDVYYLSLPVIDKAGKIIRSVSNEELFLRKYDLVEKIDNNRCSDEILIDQIRDLIKFTNISSHYSKKIVLINGASALNNESSASLLKTLEEVESNCTFILLCDNYQSLKDTIVSRCQRINLDSSSVIMEHANFESFFFSIYPLLKNYSTEYELYKIIENTKVQIDSLLNKDKNPIEISDIWYKQPKKIIFEIIHVYLLYLSINPINLNIISSHKNANLNVNKLIDMYNKMFKLKRDLSLNVNSKYLFNNISIELAL